MSNHGCREYGLRRPAILPFVILLSVYFLCRLVFQQLSVIKTGFIFPTGLLVEMFYGTGDYTTGEWLFNREQTRFVLGESCSGTTFFSLLLAYIAFRINTHRTSLLWLAYAYPITLIANAMRVLSSNYAHNVLGHFGAGRFADHAHVMTGAVAFLCSFLIVAYVIERPKTGLQYEI